MSDTKSPCFATCRDFLIKAFNRDMPYDRFVRWQLAGDELAPDNPLALMATGFLGGGAFPTEITEHEFETVRYDELDDMVGTTGTAMLGLTIGCARCHDHKYDPIPTRSYYRLASTFTHTIRCQGRSKFGPLRRSKSRPVGEGVAVFVGRLERSLWSPFRAAQA